MKSTTKHAIIWLIIGIVCAIVALYVLKWFRVERD